MAVAVSEEVEHFYSTVGGGWTAGRSYTTRWPAASWSKNWEINVWGMNGRTSWSRRTPVEVVDQLAERGRDGRQPRSGEENQLVEAGIEGRTGGPVG